MNSRTRFRARFYVPTLLAASLTVGSARAAAQSAADEPLIQQGIALRTQGRDAEALAIFEQAHAQFQTARALAQIALAEQALGRWERADQHLRAALATQDPWIDRNRPALDGALAQLQQRLCVLELVDGVAGAQVRVDGRAMGTLPQAATMRLVRGGYTLEIEAEGYYPLRRSVDLSGPTARESVEMRPRPRATSAENPADSQANTEPPPRTGPARPPPERVPPAPSAPERATPVGGIVLASVGGASALASVAFFIVRSGAEGELQRLGCALNGGYWECANPAAQEVHSNGNTMNTLGHVALWGGLALAGAGVTWIALGGASSERRARAAWVAPMVGYGARGLAWGGSF